MLVVRLDATGDFVLWLHAAEALRRLYPPGTHHITLAGNCAWTDLAALLPYWDTVWAVDRRRLAARWSHYRLLTLWKTCAAGFDIALQPTYSREKRLGDALVRASRAAERIGFDGDLSNMRASQKRRTDAWYTRLVAASPGLLPEIQRNAEFVRALGASDGDGAPPALAPLPGEPFGMALPPDPYFVLAPAAQFDIKRWPPERFASIASRVHRETGWTPVITGTPAEAVIAGDIARRLTPAGLNLAGRTSLPQLAALLRRARLVIANDTLAVHLAAAVGTPAVCIAGGGHWGRFVPYAGDRGRTAPVHTVHHAMPCYSCGWHCTLPRNPGGAAPCLTGITVDMVWQSVSRALAGTVAGVPAAAS